MINLAGKTALVTGAAGGIGSAICGLLSTLDAAVIACDRNEDGLDQLSKNVRIHTLLADITDSASVASGLKTMPTHMASPTILVNNAGYSTAWCLEECSLEDWRKEIDGNLTGAYIMTEALRGDMIASGGGVIVNIGSVNSMLALGNPAYSAAKAALESYTKALAVEFGPYNIRSNLVSPGTVRTPIWDSRVKKNPAVFERLRKWYPLGRVAEPIDIAHAVAFLCSDAAAFINGATLVVDGGLTAGNAVLAHELTLSDKFETQRKPTIGAH